MRRGLVGVTSSEQQGSWATQWRVRYVFVRARVPGLGKGGESEQTKSLVRVLLAGTKRGYTTHSPTLPKPLLDNVSYSRHT